MFYCSQQHQLEDWPQHKKICGTNLAAAERAKSPLGGGTTQNSSGGGIGVVGGAHSGLGSSSQK